MSVCVQYPSAGCIVEYLEGNAIQIALVTEERKQNGYVGGMGIDENITLASLKEIRRHGILSRKMEEEKSMRPLPSGKKEEMRISESLKSSLRDCENLPSLPYSSMVWVL